MATVDECRRALEQVASRISGMDEKDRERHLVDRTISCRVTDLGVDFRTKLGPHGADPITEAGPGSGPAQVTFSATSDDLVALADERLHLARAFATGRLKIQASIFDLLRLRSWF
jgi:predicted lipid carrier protein YhbT